MNAKWLYALFGLIVLGSVVFAISGATVQVGPELRWNGAQTAGSDTTEGGNITAVNVSSVSLTDRWASYFGNVTGSIILDDNGIGNAVYTWSWAPAAGGEVCVSEASAFNFATAAAATAANIDSVWGFTGVADSAANTYNNGSCSLTFTPQGAKTGVGADIQGVSSYISCAIAQPSPTQEDHFAFCAVMNSSGVNYDNVPSHYEVIVPTTNGSGTETYYFYAELN